MSPIDQRSRNNLSMFRWLKEVYFSVFVLFFRLSRWKGRMKERTASMGVSGLLGILVVIIWAAIQMTMHQRVVLNRWVAIAVLGSLFAVNDYILVVRRGGAEFEKQFLVFKKGKQVRLYVAGMLIIVGSIAVLFVSVSAYHHMFGIS